jgi:hypothetical protein
VPERQTPPSVLVQAQAVQQQASVLLVALRERGQLELELPVQLELARLV